MLLRDGRLSAVIDFGTMGATRRVTSWRQRNLGPSARLVLWFGLVPLPHTTRPTPCSPTSLDQGIAEVLADPRLVAGYAEPRGDEGCTIPRRQPMRIAGAAVALAAALLALWLPDAAHAKWTTSTIQGSDLPRPVSLALEDDLAFYGLQFAGWPGRDARPVLLDGAPSEPGTAYEIDSLYWSKAASTLDLGDAYVIATYYPAVSAAQVQLVEPQRTFSRPEPIEERLGEVAWVRLDDRRATLLNRYIELGRAGLLPAEPNFVDAAVARRDAGEVIGIHVGPEGVRLDNRNRADPGIRILPDERRLRGANAVDFWAAAPDLADGYQPYLTPDAFGHDVEMFGRGIDPREVSAGWLDLRFVLPEGRDETYTYFPEIGYLVDLAPVSPGSGTPTLRSWRVPEEMQRVLAAPSGDDSGGTGAAVIGGGVLVWVLGAIGVVAIAKRRSLS